MTTVAKLVSDLRKRLTGATTELQSEIARLRSEIIEKRRSLENAQRAPLPVEEIIVERIPQVVAEVAADWLKQYGSALVQGDHALGSPNLTGSMRLPWGWDPLPWGALCAARPELAGEILGALVQRVSYEPGPRSGERAAVIAKLERELTELEQGEEALIDEAAASGVVIQHRPEVMQRRETERRRREREEQAASARKAREEELNRRHQEEIARGRAVPSPYLANRPER